MLTLKSVQEVESFLEMKMMFDHGEVKIWKKLYADLGLVNSLRKEYSNLNCIILSSIWWLIGTKHF